MSSLLDLISVQLINGKGLDVGIIDVVLYPTDVCCVHILKQLKQAARYNIATNIHGSVKGYLLELYQSGYCNKQLSNLRGLEQQNCILCSFYMDIIAWQRGFSSL